MPPPTPLPLPTLLPKGPLTLQLSSLSHLFHATLAHLSKLNAVCRNPFGVYNEWEMFDGTLFALDLDQIFALPAFIKNQSRCFHRPQPDHQPPKCSVYLSLLSLFHPCVEPCRALG